MKAIICDQSYKNKWAEFIAKNAADFGLLQSWEWGDFQESLGRKIFKLAILDDWDNILALVLIIKQPLKLGRSYFYLPRGPVISQSKEEFSILEILFQELEKLAKKEKAIFLRMDPAWPNLSLPPSFVKRGEWRYVGQVQPKSTLILDLTKAEAELLAAMKSKTRYNIKVAEKNGVIIDKGEKYFEDFWVLIQKTSGRQEIKPYSKNYYQKLLSVLVQAKLANLVVAKFEDKVIAANIIININHWSVYLYGASDYGYRSKMAPYLLQWQSIIEAKENGAKYYDFWGVDENKWPGVTRFKMGFAPAEKFTDYIGAWDKVYSQLWYNIYSSIKKFSIFNF